MAEQLLFSPYTVYYTNHLRALFTVGSNSDYTWNTVTDLITDLLVIPGGFPWVLLLMDFKWYTHP